MDRALKIALVLVAVPLLIGGSAIMFSPHSFVDKMGLAPSGPVGLNSMRGAIGGMVLGSGVMLVLGLVRRNTVWFLAVAVIMGAATLGRGVGLVADGFDPGSLRPFIVELVIVVLTVAAHRRLGSDR